MKFSRNVIILLLCFIVLVHNGELLSQAAPLYLIPMPQKIELSENKYVFPSKVQFNLADPLSSEDKFTVSLISETLLNELKLQSDIAKKGTGVYLGIPGKSNSFDALLKKEKIIITAEIGTEGYILKITPEKIIITGNTAAGVFYGAQTLIQIIKSNRTENTIPCLTIYDWPDLKLRGWMDDISRGPIPTMEFLKNVIKTMAGYKQNYFTLYTEHTFRLKKYPDIAPQEGITADEIAELTEYAEKYHIELVGNEQSFGHMEKILSIPFYSHLKESPSVLNPSIEETYKFLEDVYSEIAPAYKSSLFNINCDETYGLGNGPAKIMVDSIGLEGVYAHHINRIDALLKKYGKSIMMWGDIAINNKGIIEKLPKDMIILSWGYHAAESFDDAILPFKNSGFRFMVAPGVSCWSQVWPNMSNAAINISNYVRDGYKLGAMGMMNTAWDDDGENLFNYNWHGLIWGAECSWKPASAKTGDEAVKERNEKLALFNSSFDKLFYGCNKLSATNILLTFDEIRKINIKNIVSDGAVWSSMLDLLPEYVDSAAVANNRKAGAMAVKLISDLEELKKDAARNSSLVDHAIFAAKRVLFTTEKNIVRADIAGFLKEKNPQMETSLRKSFSSLSAELFSLKKEYIRLWGLENRGWWLDKALDKYNKLGEQFRNIDKTVLISDLKQVNGKTVFELSTLFNDKDIYYTINAEQPTWRSDKYSKPVEINGPAFVRACVFEKTEKYGTIEKYFLNYKSIVKIHKMNSTYSRYNPAYSGGGDNALIDGFKGSDNFADGRWQGFQGQDLNVTLDFGSKIQINKFCISCLQDSYSWILMPSKVQLFGSDDDNNYLLIKEIPNTTDPMKDGVIISDFKTSLKNASFRYIKIICVYPGNLPEKHHAAGNPSFIFADEIIVE